MKLSATVASLGLLVAAGVTVYATRAELIRYLRILQMASDPSLVGASVTPQGNQAALGQSAEQRRRNRLAESVTAE